MKTVLARADRLWALPCWLALSVLLATSARAQQPAPRPTIERVTVGGTYLVSGRALAARLGLRQGARLDRKGLQQRLERLNESGLLGEASVRITPLGAGRVAVHVLLSERIKVAAVRFKGNRQISAERLSAAAGIKAGQQVDPPAAKRAQQRIGELYIRSGFPLASVHAYARFTRQREAILVFDIVEGPRAWVGRVSIEGNRAYSDQTLRSIMKTRARGWPAFLRPGRFDDGAFAEDLSRIEQFYYDAGYLDASVGGYWTYGRDLSRITAHVLVYEGPRYTTRSIRFEGNTIFRDEELLQSIPLAVGKPVSPRLVEEAKAAIRDLYGRQGYVDVGAPGKDTLRATLTFSEREPTADVVFSITEGQPVFIRRIRVEGLTKTSELVVLRNLTFHPGDRASTEALKESERKLLSTGYFDLSQPRPVEISIEPGEQALRDAIVRVKEGPTGAVWFGLSIGSATGVAGRISIRERNFDITRWPSSWRDLWEGNALRGGGQQLVAELSVGSEQSSFLLSFLDPAVNNSPYSAGAKLYSTLTRWDQFDLTRTGVSSSFGRQVGEHASWRFEAGFERITMDALASGAPPAIAIDRGTYDKPYASFTYAYDTRDNPLSPSEGYAARISAEVGLLDVDTVKVVGEAEKHWTVGEIKGLGKQVFTLRGRAAMMDSYTGGRVPVFERFYAGGAGSLRGFEPRGVSPVEPVAGKQVGWRSMLVGSAEYSVPVTSRGLRAAAFLDAGYVKEDPFEVFSGWDELRVTPGVGLRWHMPALGNLALSVDLAFPAVKESADRTRSVHFTLGAGRWF